MKSELHLIAADNDHRQHILHDVAPRLAMRVPGHVWTSLGPWGELTFQGIESLQKGHGMLRGYLTSKEGRYLKAV